MNTYTLEIKFKLPIVGDRLSWRNPNSKQEGYTFSKGRDIKGIFLKKHEGGERKLGESDCQIHRVETIRLRWSRFRWTKLDPSKSFLGVDVTVTTRTLTIDHFSDSRLYRLYLIDGLHQIGLTNRGIADHLNQRGILSPRGGSYFPKLVWVTHKKFKRRQERRTPPIRLMEFIL